MVFDKLPKNVQSSVCEEGWEKKKIKARNYLFCMVCLQKNANIYQNELKGTVSVATASFPVPVHAPRNYQLMVYRLH